MTNYQLMGRWWGLCLLFHKTSGCLYRTSDYRQDSCGFRGERAVE